MAAKTVGFKYSIGLIDGVTGPLAAINKKLAEMQAPAKKFQAQVDKFKDLSGISRLSEGFKTLKGHVVAAVSTMTKMVPVLGLITSAASLAGMFKLIEAWGQLGTRLLNTTAIVGGSVTGLQQMQNAARLAGSSADDMTSSIQGLGHAAQDALSGRNKEAAALFQAYGVSVRKSGYQAKDGATMMGDAFEIIKKLHDKGASPAVVQQAMGILGLSSGLTRFAMQGRAGLEKFNKLAEHFGLISPKAAEQADAMRESFSKLQMAVEGFGNAIAEKAGGPITELLTWMAELIRANKDWIATRIGEYIKRFTEYIKGAEFHKIAEDLRNAARYMGQWASALGKFGVIINDMSSGWGAWVAGITAAALVLRNPVTLAALAIWIAYYKNLIATREDYDAHMRTLEPNSPAWQGIPEETQKKYPNSPYNADTRSPYEKWAPKWLGGKDRKYPPREYDSSGKRKLPVDAEYEVRRQARLQGVDEDHAVRLADQENSWDRDSPMGAMGTMGLMQRTADDLHVNPRDFYQNIEGGIRYFKQMLGLFGGNYAAATAAYNAGPNNLGVKKFAATGDPSGLPYETQRYLKAIIPTGKLPEQSTTPVAPAPAQSDEVSRVLNKLRQTLPGGGGGPGNDNNASGAQALRAQQGNLQVTIHAPAGFGASARVAGNVVRGAPRIVSPMIGIG